MHFTMYVWICESTWLDLLAKPYEMNDLVGFIVALVALRVNRLQFLPIMLTNTLNPDLATRQHP